MSKYICFNRTDDFSNIVRGIIDTRKQEILDFFEVEDDGRFNFNVYIYDSQEELVTGLKERGFSEDPPHMCACSKDEDHSLNYFEPEDKPVDVNSWSKEEYLKGNVIFHEEIHGIQSYIYGKQPEWLTEGVAKYLDGTYSKGIPYLLKNYISKDQVPSMSELVSEFGWHQDTYDAYDYAYLIVSYLIDVNGKSGFVKSIYDSNYLKKLEDSDVVQIAVSYYYDKYDNDEKGLNFKI